MSAEVALLAYAACGLAIVGYAWLRSTTPAGAVFLILMYLMLGAALFAHFEKLAAEHRGLITPSTIVRLQLVTGGLLGWLIVRRTFAANAPAASPSFFGFVIRGIAAVLIGVGISLAVHAAESDPLAGPSHDLRSIAIGFPLCLAAVFFRDHRVAEGKLPSWLRCAESCGCTMTMVLGLLVLYLGQLVRLPIEALRGWQLAIALMLPTALAMVIGGCVASIGRAKLSGPPVAADGKYVKAKANIGW